MQRIAQSGEGLGTAQTELYGLARSIAELEWLLLLLVMVYSVVTQMGSEERIHLAGAIVLYAVLVDADRLKAINNNYGHEAGNKLIQQVAENLCRVLRGSDVVGRFGGEEFVILLPECSLVDA